MRQRVDAEGGVPCLQSDRDSYLLDRITDLPDQQSRNKASPNVSAHGIIPTEFRYECRQHESREERDADVVPVLEDDDYAARGISKLL